MASAFAPDYYIPTDYEDSSDSDHTHISATISNKLLILSFLIIFIALLMVIGAHFSLKRLQRSRRRLQSHLTQMDVATVHGMGLDKAVLSSLPTFIYSASPKASGSVSGDGKRASLECAVCLCEFEEGEEGRTLPSCEHSFHTQCIDMWFFSHKTCPLCRSDVQANVIVTSLRTLTDDSRQQRTEEELDAAGEVEILIRAASPTTSSSAITDSSTGSAVTNPILNISICSIASEDESKDSPFRSSGDPEPSNGTSTSTSSKLSALPPRRSSTKHNRPHITIQIPSGQEVLSTSSVCLSAPHRTMKLQMSPNTHNSCLSPSCVSLSLFPSQPSIRSPGIRASLSRISSMQSATGERTFA
ncbi:hypothetical protein KP509_21G001200 [Ceratopteris richardii]|uniref:RING-type E3 ubiquitin transferase n=1 Tax=Ceratopteris richardii TaxID=49495 RepID=A0A8T2S8V2_CERRI|nr:hypothetical protein KP509_21G001200 [Ceratopteris richardii]